MPNKIQVFVSSSLSPEFDDFDAERNICREEIDRYSALFEAWLFEDAPASSRSLERSYLDEVDKCGLFILLLGSFVRPAVQAELNRAMEKEKPILAFLRNVQNEPEEINRIKSALDRKYATYSTPEDFRRKLRDALADELRLRMGVGEPGEDPILRSISGKLGKYLRERKTVEVVPTVPSVEFREYLIVGRTGNLLDIERLASSIRIRLDVAEIERIVDHGETAPPSILLRGRLQWLSQSQSWRVFPEKPSSDHPLLEGVGKPFYGSVDDFLSRMGGLRDRIRVWREDVWNMRLREGWQVFYDKDGKYVRLGREVAFIKMED